MEPKIQDLKERLSQMVGNRSAFEAHWQEIVDNILWFRQNFLGAVMAGAKKMSKINDSTATNKLILAAWGVSGNMANPATLWFALQPQDDNQKNNRQVRIWLDYLEKVYYSTFARSNFYTADQEGNVDLLGFGTAPIFTEKHYQWGCCYHNLNLAECYFDVDQYGRIDTMYRKFEFTARQMVQKWGEEGVSAKVREALKGNRPTEKVTLLHAIYPREERVRGKLDSRNMPWVSVYAEIDNEKMLEEGGYRSFPVAATRHMVMPGEVYGRSLAMMALPDVKELQIRVRDTTMAGQLRARPPVFLRHDGFANVPVNLMPGGHSFIHADGPIQEMIGSFPVASDLTWSEESIQNIRKRISDVFLSESMIISSERQTTRAEFVQVAQEKMKKLGTLLTRLETERYQPIFDRTFEVLWHLGRIPMPPRELIGADGELKYRIEYISPLAKAQRLAESQGILQTVGFIGQAMAIKKDVADIWDWDESVRVMAENNSAPAKLIIGDEQLAAIREARDKQMQEEKLAAMAAEAAKAMPALSKGPEPGSPMDQLTQGFQQGAGNA